MFRGSGLYNPCTIRGPEAALSLSRLSMLLLVLWLPACASQSVQSGGDEQPAAETDPFEPLNRKVFAFNQTLDDYLARPAARGYREVTPGWLDDGITRLFENLRDLRSAINGVLQWEWGNAGNNFGRFTVNSTLGVAGFFDVASSVDLRKTPEDFGLTLAKWGTAQGPYLVLPVLGPSTSRAAAGLGPDYLFWPPNFIDHTLTRYSVEVTNAVDQRAGLLDLERAIVGDRYTFIRDTYLQNRRYKTGQEPPVDDFGDGFEDTGEGW